MTKDGAGISQCFIKFWLKFLWFLFARSLPTKEIFCFSYTSYWGVFHVHVFRQNIFYQVLFIMFRFWFLCYSHCFNILLACNISAMSYFTSLLEHCKCFPREDVFPIFSLGSVREIHSLGKYFSVHSLGHSEYQEIHTFSALNIDSVKINTSLLMMRECDIQHETCGLVLITHRWSCFPWAAAD